jgi:hypothetical protein
MVDSMSETADQVKSGAPEENHHNSIKSRRNRHEDMRWSRGISCLEMPRIFFIFTSLSVVQAVAQTVPLQTDVPALEDVYIYRLEAGAKILQRQMILKK